MIMKWEFILRKKLSNAMYVTIALALKVNWNHTRQFMKKRNLFSVFHVMQNSSGNQIWRDTQCWFMKGRRPIKCNNLWFKNYNKTYQFIKRRIHSNFMIKSCTYLELIILLPYVFRHFLFISGWALKILQFALCVKRHSHRMKKFLCIHVRN